MSDWHKGRHGYYGWRPSLPDHHDLRQPLATAKIAAEVDPRGEMPPVYDQGQLGSCTANAVAAAMQYDLHLDGEPFDQHRPSRLMLYYQERQLEGSLGQGDTGAVGRDGFKALQQYGWVPEREWPYHISHFEADPPAALWIEAATRKLAKPYAAVTRSVTQFQAALTNRQTIAFGFTVYESFESGFVAASGVVPMPLKSEQVLGGHEVLMVGYTNEHPGYFLCRNSWGTGWGDGGYFWMPSAYLMNPGLASDFRTIVRGTS